MTILVGFSATRHSDAPINLAVQIALSSGDSVVAAAIVEGSWPPKDHAFDREFVDYVTARCLESLNRVVDRVPGDLDIPRVVHHSSSVPTGLIELAADRAASLVVVGSSSSGLLGRVALGSVTGRLVHTAAVPVAIAPRGYPSMPGPLRRITAAYGGEADANGLLRAAAELAKAWSVALRVVSFTVRPTLPFGGVVDSGVEDLVVQQWAQRTQAEVAGRLDAVRPYIAPSDVEVIVGRGRDWRDAVESLPWVPGDLLALGSGAAGQSERVFLGSVASKILRHAPVPVLILPRRL
jgi:nucleotide-binding universal stress UspA family protein